MGKCVSSIEEIRFKICEHETECYVFVRAEGDCPLCVQGWHYKSFREEVSVVDILSKEFEDYMLWPLNAPPGNYK